MNFEKKCQMVEEILARRAQHNEYAPDPDEATLRVFYLNAATDRELVADYMCWTAE
jgi:hypothetical protein